MSLYTIVVLPSPRGSQCLLRAPCCSSVFENRAKVSDCIHLNYVPLSCDRTELNIGLNNESKGVQIVDWPSQLSSCNSTSTTCSSCRCRWRPHGCRPDNGSPTRAMWHGLHLQLSELSALPTYLLLVLLMLSQRYLSIDLTLSVSVYCAVHLFDWLTCSRIPGQLL